MIDADAIGGQLEQRVDALLVVPLSAHALFARPLVLGPRSRVTCQLIDTPENRGVVWCDGRRSVDLSGGMEIEVVAGAHRLRMARLGLAPFTDRLVRKFDLPVIPLHITARNSAFICACSTFPCRRFMRLMVPRE